MLYPVFGMLALAALGGGYEMVRESLDRGAYPMHGQLVDVGGRRLYIQCVGSGSPTVVLQAGLGEPTSPASGWIAPAVAQDTRVCVYDRAGRGWSEDAAGPQDGVAIAADLHSLLERAQIAGPYVLAGHSSGGVYMRIFAAQYPDQVAGMVLLDSQPNEAFTRLPAYPTFYAGFRRVSALFPSFARLGVMRLFYRSANSGLPPQARAEERAIWSTARQQRSLRDEFAELPTALKQAQALTSLGDKPLIVITAGKGAQDGWLPLQDEMATLSTNSLHRVLPEVEHASLVEDQGNAALSSQAIHDVVEAVRTAGALTTP
jgi:pimeloyl-ACP methyl ester carboxylesterase